MKVVPIACYVLLTVVHQGKNINLSLNKKLQKAGQTNALIIIA